MKILLPCKILKKGKLVNSDVIKFGKYHEKAIISLMDGNEKTPTEIAKEFGLSSFSNRFSIALKELTQMAILIDTNYKKIVSFEDYNQGIERAWFKYRLSPKCLLKMALNWSQGLNKLMEENQKMYIQFAMEEKFANYFKYCVKDNIKKLTLEDVFKDFLTKFIEVKPKISFNPKNLSDENREKYLKYLEDKTKQQEDYLIKSGVMKKSDRINNSEEK